MTSGVRYEMTIVAAGFGEIYPTFGDYSALEGDMTIDQTWVGDMGGGWQMSSFSGSSLAIERGLDGVATESASLSGSGGGRYAMQLDQQLEAGPGDTAPLAYRTSVTARICSTTLGGCLNAVTDPPLLRRYDDYLGPSSGSVRFADGASRFVDVTAVSGAGDVQARYDVGAGVQGPFATTWGCLDAVDSSGCFVP
jgi:hypothetical protein